MKIAAKREKIKIVLQKGGEAVEKEVKKPAVTVDFIKHRLEIDKMPKTPATTRLLLRLGIGSHQDTRTARIDAMQALYNEGVMGFTLQEMKKKKRQWRKPAWIEGVHTVLGARLPHAVAGVAVSAVDGVGEKIAIKQSLGYAPQASLSGFLRIVTEILQIPLNEGGRPKLAPNVNKNAPGLKDVRKGCKATTEALVEATLEGRETLEAARRDPSPENLVKLSAAREKVRQARQPVGERDKQYRYRFNLFKREYMGKRWSALVSIIASAVGSPLSALVPAAGKAVRFAAIPFQMIASYFDYMKTQDYTLRSSAKKVDLSSLVKPESRDKPLDEITEDDIDTKVASRFYEEQPLMVMATVRQICHHKMAELVYQRDQLEEKLENLPARRFTMPRRSGTALRQRKEGELEAVKKKLQELMVQFGYFERGEGDHIDPDGLIGKALTEPSYFFRKGVSSVLYNKVGEFWAQSNQRIFNNFNPFMSVGQAAIIGDVLTGIYGDGFIAEGIDADDDLPDYASDSSEDPPDYVSDGGENPPDYVSNSDGDPSGEVQAAAAAMVGLQVAGGTNSGPTVLLARYFKTTKGRKDTAVPERIAKALSVKPAESHRQELEDALKKGLLSKGRKKKIEEAFVRHDSEPAGSKKHEKAGRVLSEWEKRKEKAKALADKINQHYLITLKDENGNDIEGKDGESIILDLRTSAACYRTYVPLAERIWIPVASIPKGMLHPVTLINDSVRARSAQREMDKADEGAEGLEVEMDAEIEALLPPRISLEIEEDDFSMDFFALPLEESDPSVVSERAEKLDEEALSSIQPPLPSKEAASHTRQAEGAGSEHGSMDSFPGFMSAEHYLECIDASLADITALNRLGKDALAKLNAEDSGHTAEYVKQLYQYTEDLQLVAETNAVRSLCTIGNDDHLYWTQTIAKLDVMKKELLKLKEGLSII